MLRLTLTPLCTPVVSWLKRHMQIRKHDTMNAYMSAGEKRDLRSCRSLSITSSYCCCVSTQAHSRCSRPPCSLTNSSNRFPHRCCALHRAVSLPYVTVCNFLLPTAAAAERASPERQRAWRRRSRVRLQAPWPEMSWRRQAQDERAFSKELRGTRVEDGQEGEREGEGEGEGEVSKRERVRAPGTRCGATTTARRSRRPSLSTASSLARSVRATFRREN